jgi:hypothetical protein
MVMINGNGESVSKEKYDIDKIKARLWYLEWKIDEYELADLLGLEYDKIGVYIMANGLKRVKT